ncbi:MAG: integrase arm-type DNA-binding domain-containing protein [Nitrospinaceae bacterium]|nr:integrase family protein [Nitrospinaceae bacterium]NIR53674.1 integrase family protein [Nitrospinaceae bacterium]NIS84081.1 integrase family protein [Nitrospinaceae bacterium]NIT80885.1 integrase family protein [Nitrospinaceae bacterium]NIU43184.1 integrase family protein [Nitrospinaceae bacterium]
MSLTERKIKYLAPGKSRQIVWDNGGFGMQVAPDGEKSFILEYRFNEMTKMITLGVYPAVSLEVAKHQAIKAFQLLMKGVDPEEGLPEPGQAATKPQLEPVKGKTSSKLDQMKEKAAEKLGQLKTSEAYGQLKEKATETIGQIKTSETLEHLKEKASQKLGQIKDRVEKKAVPPRESADPSKKIIPLDKKVKAAEKKAPPPEKKAKPPEKKAKPPEKKAKPPSIKDDFGRILDKSEIKILWTGLPNSDMPPSNQFAVKLLMVTAQRCETIVSAKWTEFDLVARWWDVPETATASGKKSRVPLTNLAQDVLRKVKESSGMSGVLFPVPGGVAPIEKKTLEEDLRRAQLRFGIKPFAVEDLQNSMVSLMLENGVPETTLFTLVHQNVPKNLPGSDKQVADRDLRDALEKLEKLLPKAF